MRRVEENQHASSLQLSKEVESQTGVTIGAFPLHGTVRFGIARYGSVRVGLHFHRSLVPL